MKVLILGGDGMLGHQLLKAWSGRHEVRATLRRPVESYRDFRLFNEGNAIGGVDAFNAARLASVIRDVAPDAVVNCIGIVKQRADAKAAIPSITINALLPHQLREWCEELGARLIHLSTDCVFSGRRGAYLETDVPDPVDLYGRSKLLGEVADTPGLTLRTSIIGLELSRKSGLIEWFLAQRGMIRGFRRAVYTGLTTIEMARLVERILVRHPSLHGVWQVASAPINKYELLVRLAQRLGRTDIEIAPDDEFVCDRSLLSDRFDAETGYRAPSWDDMIDELAGDIRARARPAPSADRAIETE
ncbi:MAG: SDR family oxidoreductase [Vicinamibacterales bacterium]